jgi:hypothetical protein
MPAGAARPTHDLSSKPGRSIAIGAICGSVGHGCALVTPSPPLHAGLHGWSRHGDGIDDEIDSQTSI